MAGPGVRGDCTADVCVCVCAYVCMRVCLLLAASTLNNAVGLFDRRLIDEAGVLGVTWLQVVPSLLMR